MSYQQWKEDPGGFYISLAVICALVGAGALLSGLGGVGVVALGAAVAFGFLSKRQ